MSDFAVDAIESVLEGIADAVVDPTVHGQGRLLALSRALDALTNFAATFELVDEPEPAPIPEGPAVFAAHPAFSAAWLDGRRNDIVLRSIPFETVWHKVDGWWWTTGSEVALDSLDLAAQGPFAVLSEPK
ncbi:hypothetical protein [Nocardia acidivorans]|uniref:hypothetical protein n=1 Tax=Nocardia acidivorans TaxID=404580 RepID=UPI0008368884|nr:hypothetical protein [Nocardia acidivorans]